MSDSTNPIDIGTDRPRVTAVRAKKKGGPGTEDDFEGIQISITFKCSNDLSQFDLKNEVGRITISYPNMPNIVTQSELYGGMVEGYSIINVEQFQYKFKCELVYENSHDQEFLGTVNDSLLQMVGNNVNVEAIYKTLPEGNDTTEEGLEYILSME